MTQWMEKHFGGVADPPKKLRPDPERDRGGRFWFFLILLFAFPTAAVGGAWWLGYLDPVIKELVTIVREPAPTTPTSPTAPNATITYQAKQSEPDNQRTITQARTNELQRLITSRQSGLDLMGRDRGKAAGKYKEAESLLSAAKDRLVQLERVRPGPNDTRGSYEWNLAHNDAVAAAKNATTTLTAQQKVLNSLDGRIAKAKQELDDAKAELDGAIINP